MKRIALTTVFIAVAVPSVAARAVLPLASSTSDDRRVATRYQIVVRARIVGRLGEAAGRTPNAWG